TAIYTLSLHDALPILGEGYGGCGDGCSAGERDREDQRKQPSRLARQLGRAVRGHGQVIWSWPSRGLGRPAQSSQLHPSPTATTRSEEHTSELQSLAYL